ncbi:STAS domain-containing protein [Streptomyces sp. M92]|uniref:STAS domain-containing protein n=1 Tax=Streptomyces sp. M92 TaxID=2944250 RepID=UPI00234B9B0E|nr:STAS domain-containing protein [Streptomyces sp. M92]WCN05214.1 STAS domain-containing protein [Streptomyces sp. M92]
MTTSPDEDPTAASPSVTGPHTVRLALDGDLDYDTCGELLRRVRLALDERADVEDLRLDCRELGVVDSMGLSTLLQIHRSACRDGIGFHLDNIGPALKRLLELTGTYDYLVSPQRTAAPADE